GSIASRSSWSARRADSKGGSGQDKGICRSQRVHVKRGIQMKFGLMTECRNPAKWRRPDGEVYADIIDQMVMAESLGFGYVDFLEHHFTEDGYLPSPLMMASAVAARTKTMHVCTNIA